MKLLSTIFCIIAIALGAFLWWKRDTRVENVPLHEDAQVSFEGAPNQDVLPAESTPEVSESSESVKAISRKEQVKQIVPFTSQAPSGQWDIRMFQDACEEASMIMAAAWVRGQRTLAVDEVERTVQVLAEYEENRFGQSIDLSPEDTTAVLKEYFGLSKALLVESPTKQRIIDALYDGMIVIVPTDGKALGNPFFTAGGPDRHMLVLIGYDPGRKEFITNDPGTRHGEGYRYDEDVLYDAIRSYRTGDHELIEAGHKAAILVQKTS